MRNTAYNLISRSFEDQGNPSATRVELVSPQLVIRANRLRTSDDTVLLNEVWLEVKTEVALTRAQIESALSLRGKNSQLDEAAKTLFTAIESTRQRMPFDDFIDGYVAESSTLCSISDKPPTTSINDTIIDGPVEVPSHAWSRYYAAFEAYDKAHPEFGMAWDSVVLYRDGVALRKAEAPNLMHTLLPQTAQVLEGVEFRNDLEAAVAVQRLVESDEDVRAMTSLDDVLGKLTKAPEPFISPTEINQMGEFASELLQKDITELEYAITT